MPEPALGKGVYTLQDVARYTRMHPKTTRSWFVSRHDNKPIFNSDYGDTAGGFSVSFFDLIDAHVALHLKSKKFSLQRIRKIYSYLEKVLGPHPFCHEDLYTSGKDVFYSATGRLADSSVSVQKVFEDQEYIWPIMKDCLSRVNYEHSIARSWDIAESVRIDPRISFGMPVVLGTGTRTYTVARAYYANDEDTEFVSRLYKISQAQVQNAVAFSAEYNELSAIAA